MPEPFIFWQSGRLVRYGLACLVVGLVLLTSDRLEAAIGLPPRASLVISLIFGMYTVLEWQQNPGYANALQLLSTAVVLLLPLLICVQLFREILVID